MSSSVFVETPRSASDPLLEGDSSAAKADSNLVVVYGKNGINVDRQGLENLIDEKTLTSISVIRITSPTPSMKDEEAEEIRKEVEEKEGQDQESHSSEGENDDDENSNSDEESTKTPKPVKTPAKERPEIVGLTVEEFYPPNEAKELAKQILKFAGVTELKCNVDYEFQRYVINNDHCYTPYTSPSQLNKEKEAAKEEEKNQPSSIRKPIGSSSTIKHFLNKRKTLIDEQQRKTNEKEKDKSTLSASDNDELSTDKKRTAEEQEDGAEEDLDDDGSDYTAESEESAETDNDRDSDSDFDVNNRHGRKRKTGLMRKKKKEKQRARSVVMQKAGNNKRRLQSQDNAHEEEKKPTRQLLDGRKSMGTFNQGKGFAKKQTSDSADGQITTSQAPSSQSKQLINIQSVQIVQPSTSIQPEIVDTPPTQIKSLLPKPIQSPVPTQTVPQSPQTIKQIAINKVIASPKGGFTDLSTLLTSTESTDSLRVSEIKPSPAPPVKGFMPLGIEMAAKNQLPAQISIQTHQSSSEIAAENDKQLDLIDSIVKDELEKSFKSSDKPPIKENSIPDLVKMLESTEKAVLEKNKLTSFTTASSVETIDIANAPLLETPDDDIPEDLLRHVVELMEDESLQEAVEKEVLQQQQKLQLEKQQQQLKQQQLQQQQKQQQLQHQQKQQQQLLLQQKQQQLQQITKQSQSLLLPQIVMQPVIKQQPKSIIEASISNTTTPSSSRDTTPTSVYGRQTSVTFTRREPIQIVRGNGRVITLPPIEAPTTRAKRRAQAQPASDLSFNDSESCDVSMHSDTSIITDTITHEKTDIPLQKERVAAAKTSAASKRRSAAAKSASKPPPPPTEIEEEEESQEDEDDPNKLWCICRQPHNNRFMICCDVCEDWFHGTCVSITKAMGLEMEQKGIEWTCPKCVKKQEAKKQRKITDLFDKKNLTQTTPIMDEVKKSIVPVQAKITDLFDKKTLVQPMPRLDEPVKVTIAAQNKLATTELAGDKKQIIDLKKVQQGQIITLTKTDSTKKTPARLDQNSPVASPMDKKFILDTSVKKTPEISTPPVNKRVIVLPSTTPKTPQGRGATMIKASVQQQQQQLKLTKVPTAAEKKQFGMAKAQQQLQGNKTILSPTPVQSDIKATSSPIMQQQKISFQKKEEPLPEHLKCIVCKKAARENSIYCSDDCIRKHAQNALNAVKVPEPIVSPIPVKLGPDEKKKKSKGLFEDLLSMADRKPKVERVIVLERRTGKVLTGNNAPTTLNLKKWLQENPTFEVVVPGSVQAQEIEKSKQKGRQNMQSPTSISTPLPPLKPDGPIVTSVITLTPPTMPSPQPVFPKIAKVNELNKSQPKPSNSPTVQVRSSTPKQLPKYPQQVSIRPDKPEKDKDKSAPSPSAGSSQKTLKKQVSTEKEAIASQTPTRVESTEPVRVNVRRTLKEQLLIRMKEVSDDKKLTTEQVDEFVKATEQEMYRLFNKDIGTKYKAKYRSLMFNIKDRKNETLLLKICGKLIEPRQLVRMSPEEMASQELAQWRENEAKHQLEMIKKSELDLLSCTKSYVLKTHKGEEVIEGKATDRVELDIGIPVEDVVAVLNNSTVSSTTENEPSSLTPRKDNSFELDSSVITQGDAIPVAATSSSDKKKAPSRERERDREKRHKSKDRHREKTRKRSRSRSRERRHKSSSQKDERRDRDERFIKKDELDSSLKVTKVDTQAVLSKTHKSQKDILPAKSTKPTLPASTEMTNVVEQTVIEGTDLKTSKERQVVQKKTVKQDQIIEGSGSKTPKDREPIVKKKQVPPIESFNLVDQILESTKTVEQAANLQIEKEKPDKASATTASVAVSSLPPIVIEAPPSPKPKPHSPSALDSDQEPSSTVSISTPPDDPYYKYSSDEEASMWTGAINMIDVASFQVSLQTVSGNTYLLSKDLPDELDVVGRISPDTVWDYIGKIKRSPNKEIVVIRLVPSAESENIAYSILYKYLDKRKRLGVIKTASPNIKDFYIMPLGIGQQMPSVLNPTENFEFYDDVMRPDMLLGIVIRIMGKRHSSASMRRKKEASVISNRTVTSILDGDGNASFTPPGSPKPRKDASRSSSSRGMRMPQKSIDDDEIDIDAIIKAPITSRKPNKEPPSSVPVVSAKKDDADEPYSPGGSSDDDVQPAPTGARDDELKRQMDEINRQIEEHKMEIAGLLSHDQSSSLANISIPSNIHQILASIQSKPDPPSTPSTPSIVPPPPMIGSIQGGTNDEEYMPEKPTIGPTNTRDIDERIGQKPSRLAQLSEAELLSMVPDNIDIDSSSTSSNKNNSIEQPPEKRPRWSEPPPPGMEMDSEYN